MATQEQLARYTAAGHRVQSGIKFLMELGRDPGTTPKHLRTGLDLRASDAKGLAELLIAKGVFTESEYVEAMIKAAIEEGDHLEQQLCELTGKEVVLG